MRNQKIVNLRAIAIIFVVLGHSIILYSSGWNLYTTSVVCKPLDYFKDLLNLIQMPLFFSISGYLFYYSQKKGKKFLDFLKDKFLRLLIPFLAFAFVWMVPLRLLIGYPGYKDCSFATIVLNKIILGYDNGHLWFLQAIFFIFIIMFFACKYVYNTDNDFVYILLGLVLLAISYFSTNITSQPIVLNTLTNMAWFYVGFLVNRYEKGIVSNKLIIPLFLLSVIVIASYFIISRAKVIVYAASLILTLLMYNIIPSGKNKILDCISSNSFGIYLFHSPLVYITYTYFSESNPGVVVLINFILFGFVSLVLSILIKKSPLKFIIGEK